MAAIMPNGRSMARCPERQGGFSFLLLLFAITLAGIALAGAGSLWQLESRREKEKELLFIGEQYRQAIGSYYAQTPGDAKQYPARFEDLLTDNRFPNPVRHLRRLYRDPMTADGEWETIVEQGRITGIVSRSTDAPIKIAGFPEALKELEGAKSYRQWRFMGADALPTKAIETKAAANGTDTPQAPSGDATEGTN